MAREANKDLRMKLLTGLDENSEYSKEEDHRMKPFTDQSKDIVPHEDGGEGGRVTLKE